MSKAVNIESQTDNGTLQVKSPNQERPQKYSYSTLIQIISSEIQLVLKTLPKEQWNRFQENSSQTSLKNKTIPPNIAQFILTSYIEGKKTDNT